jgi:hypothetical protein
MKQVVAPSVLIVVLVLAAFTRLALAQEPRPLFSGSPLSFGVDISSLKRGLGPDGVALSAVSLDLQLRWPGAPRDDVPALLRQLQPYLTFGPAVLISDTVDTPPPTDLRPAPEAGLALGVKSGAGLTWQLGKSTSLFGEYSFTRGASDRLPRLGTHTGIESDLNVHDFLYGLSVRF